MTVKLILIAFATLGNVAHAGGEAYADSSSGLIEGAPGSARVQALAQKTDIAQNHNIIAEQGRTHVLEISSTQPNRLVLPFEDPEFITTTPADAWVTGNALYVIPQSDDKLAGFIQSKDGKHAINVVLVPKQIPPQEYQFDLESMDAGGRVSGGQGSNHAHDQNIIDLLLQAVRTKGLRGYTVKQGYEAPVYVGPILVRHINSQRRGSSHLDQYLLTNKGFERREIVENNFARPDDQGIVFYPPATHLEPQQEVTMWVVRRNNNAR